MTVFFARLPRALTTGALVLLMAALTACSSVGLGNEKVNYKTEANVKPVALDVPPDLSQLSRDSRYAMPGGTVSAATLNQQSRAATGLTAPAKIADVRVERSGTQRWLVVQRPADKVWPLVREFWMENGFTYTIEQANIGLLETEWAENRAKLPRISFAARWANSWTVCTPRVSVTNTAPGLNPSRQTAPKSASLTEAWSRNSETRAKPPPLGNRVPATRAWRPNFCAV